MTLTGITIGNDTIRPTLYTRDYEDLCDKYGYEKVAKEMINKAKEEISKINLNSNHISYMKWEYSKNNLRLCIAPKGTNNGFITYPYLDLEMYVRVIVEQNGDITASYKVQYKMLEEWNITSEQLFNIAIDSTRQMYNVQSIAELLGFSMENERFPMLVINTEDGLHGASAIYYKDILKRIADKYDNDLVIIPSSINEILVKPVGLSVSLDEITELVKEVNAEQVPPEEVLSDHAYVFHRDTMEITW